MILGSGRLFSLVGLITPVLTQQQAADTLDYGLKLIEKDMRENDGGGEWLPDLHQAQEVEESLAGYIWAWHSSEPDCSPVLTSYAWGRKSGKNEYISPETGSRLLADVETLKTWLSSINMDLIIEIKIDRGFRRDSYQYRQTKTEEYLLPYTLITIFKANGKIETL